MLKAGFVSGKFPSEFPEVPPPAKPVNKNSGKELPVKNYQSKNSKAWVKNSLLSFYEVELWRNYGDFMVKLWWPYDGSLI